MTDFTLWDIVRNLLLAGRWTVVLSLIAFAGGACVGLMLTLLRMGGLWPIRWLVRLYVDLFQGTPLLMQLFLAYFGAAVLGFDISAWTAASVALTLFTSAFLCDIWRGCVEAVPSGQWQAARVLGLNYLQSMRHVILPQALRLAVPPTVGFSVQVIKGTALASVIGFVELTKAGTMLNNAAFAPFTIFALVALGYFILCYPLSRYARYLERKLYGAGSR
ncbi:amino acid ABC transporter permease [Chromohalobacter sp. 296-RDG]|uniref:amino acid ABC transporter permease n=1 Tax=Chromohalobacter sp. 296-RDG TaxID=2994062 RepID=UPI002468E407|nr:amino acid ABC transporter permease [Chromohalobacter sp. 296-RDG]